MPQYSVYQPKLYRRRMSAAWFLESFNYLLYTLREFSSLFVAYFAVIIMLQMGALIEGPATYASFQAWLSTPLMIVVNIIAFAFFLLHAITWFTMVPRVALRNLTGKPGQDAMASVPNFVIWVVASVVVALFIVRVI